MEGEEGEGLRLSKRFSSETSKSGEVEYKTKAGTAWSHSYLNQKPWHPLSYPNQRRKWIAEQTHANRLRHSEEVAREYAQEQEFFRQTALVSKKEKEKLEIMKAVSFMYVRPPGYNAESAKAAEIADEMQKPENENPSQDPTTNGASTSMPPESVSSRDHFGGEEKKKPRAKDVFGRPLPTEEEFEILKNAPRLETGVPGRVKPFGVEVRNVKCLRCGIYGHQSGDRECSLRDVIMPNEQSRLKRDDPLTAILAHTDPSEPLKWELKQKPGMSPPRGGFKSDDPNQQIVAEDIFNEYGGFLDEGNITELLTNFPSKPRRKSSKKIKHKKHQFSCDGGELDEDEFSSPSKDRQRRSKNGKHEKKNKKRNHSESSSSDDSEFYRHKKKNKKHNYSKLSSSDVSNFSRHNGKRNRKCYSSEDSNVGRRHSSARNRRKHLSSSDDSDEDRHHRSDKERCRHMKYLPSKDSNIDRHYKSRDKRSYYSSEDPDHDGQSTRKGKWKHSYSHQRSETIKEYRSSKRKSREEHGH